MKLLLLSDEEDPGLWDYYKKEKTADIDLILSCGDLKAEYLEFLVTMSGKPLFYVHGNHDASYRRRPPEGCEDIDGKLVDFHGLRIMGLGGVRSAKTEAHHYTEERMRQRIRGLAMQTKLMNGFDLLLSHAPAAGYGDLDDAFHRGFSCFNDLLEEWRPAYMAHGHVHKRYAPVPKTDPVHPSGTRILNACGSVRLEVKEDEYPSNGKTGSFLYDLYRKTIR